MRPEEHTRSIASRAIDLPWVETRRRAPTLQTTNPRSQPHRATMCTLMPLASPPGTLTTSTTAWQVPGLRRPSTGSLKPCFRMQSAAFRLFSQESALSGSYLRCLTRAPGRPTTLLTTAPGNRQPENRAQYDFLMFRAGTYTNQRETYQSGWTLPAASTISISDSGRLIRKPAKSSCWTGEYETCLHSTEMKRRNNCSPTRSFLYMTDWHIYAMVVRMKPTA